MRRSILISFALVAVIHSACAQTHLSPEADHVTGSDKGTLACKNEAAMLALTNTIAPPSYRMDKSLVAQFIQKGDCLRLPDGWIVLVQQDPPIEQQRKHASKWTTRTPNGTVHMWGMPMGGD